MAVLTHVHWDHIGGLCEFDRIAVHEQEAGWLSDGFPLPLQAVRQNLTKYPCEFPSGFVPEVRVFREMEELYGQVKKQGDVRTVL